MPVEGDMKAELLFPQPAVSFLLAIIGNEIVLIQ